MRNHPTLPLCSDLSAHPSAYATRLVTHACRLGIIRTVGELCEKHGVSIHAIHQIPIVDNDNVPFVVQTEEVSSDNIEQLCTDLESEAFCLDRPFAMPLL